MRGAWRGSIAGYRGVAIQDLGYELPRMPIPRTRVNSASWHPFVRVRAVS